MLEFVGYATEKGLLLIKNKSNNNTIDESCSRGLTVEVEKQQRQQLCGRARLMMLSLG